MLQHSHLARMHAWPVKIGVAVFAIPTGIFGAGFEDMMQSRKAEQEDEADDVPQDGGVITVAGEQIVVAPSWTEGGEESAQKDKRPKFSFLDTSTPNGKLYRNFLLFVVITDVITFFSSTLPNLQVRERERERELREGRLSRVLSSRKVHVSLSNHSLPCTTS